MWRAMNSPAWHSVFYFSTITWEAALTLGLLMRLVAFLSLGGEWFLMWQSKMRNGQDAAFLMFTVIGIVLLLVALPESEGQA